MDVRGKTVLILINDPGFATQDPALFKGNAMTYYGRWSYKYEEAARQGAAAALIIHDTAPAAYGWDVVRNSWTGPQFHLARPDDDMGRVAIQSWVQKPIAQELVEAAGYDLSVLQQQARSPEFKAVALGSTMDASVHNNIIRNQSHNVGAILPGSERPEELFIYTAHWDHLGTDRTVEQGMDVFKLIPRVVPVLNAPNQTERDYGAECDFEKLKTDQAALNGLVSNLEYFDAFARDGLIPWTERLDAVHARLDELLETSHKAREAD